MISRCSIAAIVPHSLYQVDKFRFCGQDTAFSRRRTSSLFRFCGHTPPPSPRANPPAVVTPNIIRMFFAVSPPVARIGLRPRAYPFVTFLSPLRVTSPQPLRFQLPFQSPAALPLAAHTLPSCQRSIRLERPRAKQTELFGMEHPPLHNEEDRPLLLSCYERKAVTTATTPSYCRRRGFHPANGGGMKTFNDGGLCSGGGSVTVSHKGLINSHSWRVVKINSRPSQSCLPRAD